jgi:hypothetical protein
MTRAAWLLALAPLVAQADEGKRARVEAVVEVEARRADARARARPADRLANPLELALLEELQSMMGLALLVEPISEDEVLESQRRLEALRVEVYARLSPLEPESYVALAEALGAETRAVEHRVIRLELPLAFTRGGLDRLIDELERAPTLRAMVFVHGVGADGARRVAAIRKHLDGSAAQSEQRLVLARSGVAAPGATIYLARIEPAR